MRRWEIGPIEFPLHGHVRDLSQGLNIRKIPASPPYDPSQPPPHTLPQQAWRSGRKEIGMQQRKHLKTPLRLGVAGLCCASTIVSACWEEAAARYQVNSTLLYAIARTESGLNPSAIGRNSNGTRDIGLMQINSAWLPALSRYGIRERDLFEPCTSIHVGAWILAGNIQRHGYTWEAVGAYNTPDPKLARSYIDKVRRHLPTDNTASPVRLSSAAASR
jgi:soluble lytic murein transglycosylase-like protein